MARMKLSGAHVAVVHVEGGRNRGVAQSVRPGFQSGLCTNPRNDVIEAAAGQALAMRAPTKADENGCFRCERGFVAKCKPRIETGQRDRRKRAAFLLGAAFTFDPQPMICNIQIRNIEATHFPAAEPKIEHQADKRGIPRRLDAILRPGLALSADVFVVA